jgi:2-hydroxy-3-oxopropionate reductase
MANIGLIGLGNMGSRIAINLLKSGYNLYVYDINNEKVNQLNRLGAIKCDSNEQVAKNSDIILTILPTSKEVYEVFLGQKGIINGLKDNHILVEMSSIESETIIDIHNKIKENNPKIELIDATISGVEEDAEKANILLITAGNKSIIESNLPLFKSFSKDVIYVGEIGNAKIVKTGTAMISAIITFGVEEVLVWLEKQGIDTKIFYDVIKNTPAISHVSAEIIEKLLKDKFKERPSWMRKDVWIGLQRAHTLKIPLPLTSTVYELFNLAASKGLDNFEASGIAKKLYDFLNKKS